MITSNFTYDRILIAGLLLFGFSLALSKSATNVLLFLLYPAVITSALYYKDFKKAVMQNGRQPLSMAFVLFFAVALIGVLFTEKFSDGMHVANKFLSLPAIYSIIALLIESNQDEKARDQLGEYLLLSFLIGLMILNVIGVMTYLGIMGHKKFVLPLAPLHVHHIWFSNLNAIGLYTAAAFALFSPRRNTTGGRIFFLLSIVLGMLCILLSISRTAWFGILFTVLIMAYILLANKKTFIISVMTATAACVLLYEFSPIVHNRMNLIVSDVSQFISGDPFAITSLGGRFLMWKAAIKMFLSNPLFGVGTGEFVPLMTSYIRSGEFPDFLLEFNQPHNMYLFSLATNGLLGLSALLFIFYRGLKYMLPVLKSGGEKRIYAFVAVATLVHFMIAGMTDSFFNIQILRYTFAFIMGVCVRNSLNSAPCS